LCRVVRGKSAVMRQLLAPEALVLARADRILVVAPHPDDDVLGCGALIAAARAWRSPVDVVFLTGGEASHTPTSDRSMQSLRATRASEATAALGQLGVAATNVRHLHLPDGALARLGREAEVAATEALARIIDDVAATISLVPWRRDPHPDHRAGSVFARDAIARASRAREVRVLEYVVWLDQRGDVEDRPQPGEARELRFTYDTSLAARKRAAILAHRSQTGGLSGEGFALSEAMIARACDGVETYYEVLDVA